MNLSHQCLGGGHFAMSRDFFVAALFSISAKESAFRSATSVDHIREKDPPFVVRAVHVPCQRWPVFCADHVPSSKTSPASLRSVHDPSARLGL